MSRDLGTAKQHTDDSGAADDSLQQVPEDVGWEPRDNICFLPFLHAWLSLDFVPHPPPLLHIAHCLGSRQLSFPQVTWWQSPQVNGSARNMWEQENHLASTKKQNCSICRLTSSKITWGQQWLESTIQWSHPAPVMCVCSKHVGKEASYHGSLRKVTKILRINTSTIILNTK